MNRAQRRKMAKKINTPQKLEQVTYGAVMEQTKRLKEEYDTKIKDYTEIMMVMVAYTLHLEGYGKTRLPKVMARILNNIDSFRTGHLEPNDYDIIKEEVEKMGVKI